jgi:UDP-N-acetylmuramyl pentapeptide synthase
MLLSGGPVICSRCFLQLGIDRERSKESLAALSTLDQRLEQARRMTQEH